MDWHQGFQIHGAEGSILGKTYNPWYFKSSKVDLFHESDGATHRVLGADGHFYHRQMEGFADTILTGAPQFSADLEDGIAPVRAMVAIAQSARSGQPVRLAAVSGALSMRLGIFARTFAGTGPLSVLGAAKAAGFAAVQYNMACSGLAAMPDALSADQTAAVAEASAAIAAASGTRNMIHPDPALRALGLRRLAVLLDAAAAMGTGMITLCTGTRDVEDQWHRHRDNASPEAWRDLLDEMAKACALAETKGVRLGIELELANVIDGAAKVRRLIDTLQSPVITIVLDPANLFEAAPLPTRRDILSQAVDLPAERIGMAHAKDRDAEGGFATAGRAWWTFRIFWAACAPPALTAIW